MRSLSPYLCLLLLTIFLTSCSANRLVSSWTDASLQQCRLGKILVVGIAKDETKRRIFEDTFVSSLTQLDIPAIPSYTVCKQAIEPGSAGLKAVVEKTRPNTVLITHHVGKNEEAYHPQPQHLNSISTHFPHGLYEYYSDIYRSVYTASNYSSSTKVILETNLYGAQTEKLIWSARSQSIDPVMTRKYYQKLITLFLNDLGKQNNIIP